MGNSGNFDAGTGELAPRTGEFLAGVLALSRISRVTVALESGHGAGPALLAAARLTAHAETCLLFDRWHGEPLADLAAALFGAHPDLPIATDASMAQALRTLQSRQRKSLLIIFDRFDEYLAQPADQPQIAAFDQAFVQMANDNELDVHFLLVQDEAAEHLLERYQDHIAGISDGCLRMPAGGPGDSQDGSAGPEAGRASRRDRSFGMLLERLTAIAPVDEAAAGQAKYISPADEVPPVHVPLVEAQQPVIDLAPEHEVRPMFDDATERQDPPVFEDAKVFETQPAEPDPVVTRIEPSFTPMQAVAADAPVAVPLPPTSTPEDPPARGNVLPAAPPRRGKAIAALMAVVLAVGAGVYAYRQQTPVAPGKAAATAQITPPATEPTVAAAPASAARPPAPEPVATPAAPALAAATTAPPAPEPAPSPTTTVASTAASPAPARSMPTVYVHVRSQRDRDRLQSLARTLAGQGIRVVDVKVMNTGPSVADLRYFRDEDKEIALKVQKAMVSAGVPLPHLSRMHGYENSTRPGHFEAWVGGDKAQEPARRR